MTDRPPEPGPGRPSSPEQPRRSARESLEDLETTLLGGPRTLTLGELAARVDSPEAQVRLFWHALGLPTTGPDVVAYTERDVEALRELVEAARANDLSDRTAVSLVRSIGHSTDRLVNWQVEALVEHLAERWGLSDADARLAVVGRLAEVAPILEQQLVHAWRRQVVALAGRMSAEFDRPGLGTLDADGRDPDGTGAGEDRARDLPLARAVGFADIVAFTNRTMNLSAPELAAFVSEFEARARDVVTDAGGRVVKTIGDAVLFVADDAARGADVALGLAAAFGPGSTTPARVAMVWGRVLSRFGDVFGPSVVLASRLTDVGEPGAVLVDRVTAERLRRTDEATWDLGEVVRHDVQGIGVVESVRLRRAT